MTRTLTALFTLSLLVACTDEAKDDTASTDDSAVEVVERTPPAYSGEACPELTDGNVDDFATGDTTRDLSIHLPDDPEGAPLLLAYHWLGGSQQQISNAMQLGRLADDEGVIVIAPASGDSTFDWNFLGEPEGNPDLTLTDDLVACAHAQWGVDLSRVYATGMSAGGLMTSYATLHRSELFAATMPLSGGAVAEQYVTPTDTIPVLVTWGGEGDIAVGFDFNTAADVLSGRLQADGHLVVECEHSDGHTLPNNASGLVWDFAKQFDKDDAVVPWTELPEGMPGYCRLP